MKWEDIVILVDPESGDQKRLMATYTMKHTKCFKEVILIAKVVHVAWDLIYHKYLTLIYRDDPSKK